MIAHLIHGNQTKPQEMTQLHELLRNKMVAAQLRQKEYYDLHRNPNPNLKSGDMLWLLPRNIQTTRLLKKVDYKKSGPFKILAKIGTSPYKLPLPPSMAIHNTFYISLLEPYQDNRFPSQIKEPSPPIQIEGEDQYELDEIIDSRFHYNKLQSRAKWEGYSPEHDRVWYPAENFNHAEHTVQRFHRRYPGKPRVDIRYDQQIVLRTSPRRPTRITSLAKGQKGSSQNHKLGALFQRQVQQPPMGKGGRRLLPPTGRGQRHTVKTGQ